ncbi:hypothetical protein GCM10010307_26010 [Streptomyces vastus]|uniref:Uncharacterized protein n=1 Tax=Streptomyces vastus TaxID=285451 RepID=A0ABP6D2T8_9ACTN
MGVIAELGHGARLAQQPPYRGLAVALDPLRFQRDVLPDHLVVGQPHITAPPFADDLIEDIAAGEFVSTTHGSPLISIQNARGHVAARVLIPNLLRTGEVTQGLPGASIRRPYV